MLCIFATDLNSEKMRMNNNDILFIFFLSEGERKGEAKERKDKYY